MKHAKQPHVLTGLLIFLLVFTFFSVGFITTNIDSGNGMDIVSGMVATQWGYLDENQNQIAVSNDQGGSWNDYDGNQVGNTNRVTIIQTNPGQTVKPTENGYVIRDPKTDQGKEGSVFRVVANGQSFTRDNTNNIDFDDKDNTFSISDQSGDKTYYKKDGNINYVFEKKTQDTIYYENNELSERWHYNGDQTSYTNGVPTKTVHLNEDITYFDDSGNPDFTVHHNNGAKTIYGTDGNPDSTTYLIDSLNPSKFDYVDFYDESGDEVTRTEYYDESGDEVTRIEYYDESGDEVTRIEYYDESGDEVIGYYDAGSGKFYHDYDSASGKFSHEMGYNDVPQNMLERSEYDGWQHSINPRKENSVGGKPITTQNQQSSPQQPSFDPSDHKIVIYTILKPGDTSKDGKKVTTRTMQETSISFSEDTCVNGICTATHQGTTYTYDTQTRIITMTKDGKQVACNCVVKKGDQIVSDSYTDFTAESVQAGFSTGAGYGYKGYASLFSSDESIERWNRDVYEKFGRYLGLEYWISEICSNQVDIESTADDQGTVLTGTGSSTTVAAHIEGTRSEGIYNPDPEDSDSTQYLYRLTYKINNGASETDSAALDELKFRLKIFTPSGTSSQSNKVTLEKGDSFSAPRTNPLLRYSSRAYDRVCIEFDEVPSQWLIDGDEICNDIVIGDTGEGPTYGGGDDPGDGGDGDSSGDEEEEEGDFFDF